ncbi:DUF1778 domain-containing protein [Pseudomonas syringae pv. actinidiae]|nr:DUF1778 domain-containing protein [Pseudomonas syringae pv. actinidiae]
MNSAKAAINMRVTVAKRDLIDIAAKIKGQDRTTFIIDAASNKAEKVLLDVWAAPFADFEKACELKSSGSIF